MGFSQGAIEHRQARRELHAGGYRARSPPLALTVFDAAHSETEERWFRWECRVIGSCSQSRTLIRQQSRTMFKCVLFRREKQRATSANSTRMNRDR